MRRREAEQLTVGGVPEWLAEHDPDAWRDPDDRPPADWPWGAVRWHQIRGHERWAQAGRDWLGSRGRRADWYRLTRPHVVTQ